MKNHFKIICVLMLLVYSIINAQSAYNYSDTSKELAEILSKKASANLPGGSIAVIHKGELIFENSYGVANADTQEKLNSSSQFYIASVSKTFTSAAILKLYEEGKIDLDSPVSKYILNIDYLKKVSVKQLLNHTSGIPDYYDTLDTKGKILTNKDILKFAQSTNLSFVPGAAYAYSNTAYVMLATIIETITGKPYSQYLKETFFLPLEMKNTWVKDSEKNNITNRVIGYNSDNTINDYNHLTYGAGGVYSTIDDLLKWYRAIRENRFLKEETWQIAFTPPTITNKRTYLAMGWNYEDCAPTFPELHSVASFGVLNGFRSYLFMVPELDLAIIMLSNSGEMIIGPYEVMEIYFNKVD